MHLRFAGETSSEGEASPRRSPRKRPVLRAPNAGMAPPKPRPAPIRKPAKPAKPAKGKTIKDEEEDEFRQPPKKATEGRGAKRAAKVALADVFEKEAEEETTEEEAEDEVKGPKAEAKEEPKKEAPEDPVDPRVESQRRRRAELEAMREKNKAELWETIVTLDIPNIANKLRRSAMAEQKTRSPKAPVKTRSPKAPALPQRRSVRVQEKGLTDDQKRTRRAAQPQPQEAKEEEEEEEEEVGRPRGPLAATDYFDCSDKHRQLGEAAEEHEEEEMAEEMAEDELRRAMAGTSEPSLGPWSSDDPLGQLRRLRAKDGPLHRIKLTPKRILSAAVHESQGPLVMAAGDKTGNVGLAWLSLSETGEVREVGKGLWAPHSRGISEVAFSGDSLVSASYDGFVRLFDVAEGAFREAAYADGRGLGVRCFGLHPGEPHLLSLALTSGHYQLLDLRQPSKDMAPVGLVGRVATFRTLGVHPVRSELFVTAESGKAPVVEGCGVSVWDRRNLASGPVTRVGLASGAQSASFSPGGKLLLSSETKDKMSVHTFVGGSTALLASVRHDNKTGRWLTPFRPLWVGERVWGTGSMASAAPNRTMEFYLGASSRPDVVVGGLSSVASVLGVHPRLPALFGCNSSGYAQLLL